MNRGLIVVKAAYDAEAAVWFVESSDLEGVNAEAPTLEALLQKLPGVVLDLLEDEGRRTSICRSSWLLMPGRGCAGAPPLEGLRQGRAQNPDQSKVLSFLRQGRADHEIWTSPHASKPFTAPVTNCVPTYGRQGLEGRRFAQGILGGDVPIALCRHVFGSKQSRGRSHEFYATRVRRGNGRGHGPFT
jgi:predicted RNase H-like HicB family nuclease